jgi:hypothetical protein
MPDYFEIMKPEIINISNNCKEPIIIFLKISDQI